MAEFVAQTCNETGGFTRFEEDLRYSAATMLAQWPKHFTAAQAVACVGRPVDIACRAYGGRMGNAAPPAKDGWLYRGRGMLQLTGKAAYAQFGQLVGLDLVANPDLAADPADSLVIAREFWRAAGVNAAVDTGNFTKARQLTKGGTIGLANVAAIRARLLRVLT
ncbi:glycoside hydrolase family 19 protein [Sphingomonas nostoxanthinifaciens]|uniref:glycoside hydrolase family 19 protein n=1 Tax=Sphingomonas nostoxanthinifaciens TaxID=2872652 RepID=UPI0021DADAA2|nr:glycoside hydrolase family 19 protein [Sphingomonas nostoxanthinifaciens]